MPTVMSSRPSGWGPSNDLQDVARAPNQYEGYRRANAAEAEYIRGRIRAIAAGSVPDNTNGSNSFRANYYRGRWYQRYGVNGKDVGGNIFGFVPGIANGPYAPYATPKADAPASTVPRMNMTPGTFDPNNIDPKNLMRPGPDSASPTTNNSTSNRAVHQTINSTTTFNNMDRPKEAAQVMESAFGRMHGLALQNAQSAVA